VQHWGSAIIRWSEEKDLDPNLAATVMQIESCGFEHAESPSGALGIFQVMPFHFGSQENGLDPETNAAKGLDYLKRALELAQGDVKKALAGYNAGHLAIQWEPNTWPEETQRYVYWATGILQDIAEGKETSPTLQAWLEAGGYSLCQQATLALDP
jgi:hypothetical protein